MNTLMLVLSKFSTHEASFMLQSKPWNVDLSNAPLPLAYNDMMKSSQPLYASILLRTLNLIKQTSRLYNESPCYAEIYEAFSTRLSALKEMEMHESIKARI